ncbi:hypothetical protein [Streptomyces antimicrobicus]|uniref:Uncharacterized protein n=1 Tax=Streptomyces antimicrobicus TaxID=2883108 RepID=A0ABS8BAP3_9ACTN|nr:hypothetical protein [Streptomyces antimicrobicus]MCB5181716.1 hypothetical protein [Streptomyces antimicrobicus]
MPRVSVEGADVVVRLSPREMLAARRRTVRVPVAAVREVFVEPSWWRALRGVADRGGRRPGRSVGIRRTAQGEDFTVVRGIGPVLCLDLGPGAPFGRLALSVRDPQAAERALRSALPEPEAEEQPEAPAEPEAPPVPRRPKLQHEGGVVDDHGRAPGVPSRTGTGAEPPADDERVRRANTGPRPADG